MKYVDLLYFQKIHFEYYINQIYHINFLTFLTQKLCLNVSRSAFLYLYHSFILGWLSLYKIYTDDIYVFDLIKEKLDKTVKITDF